MSSPESESAIRWRALKACAIAVALFCVAPGADVVARAVCHFGGSEHVGVAGIVDEGGLNGAASMVDRLEDYLDAESSQPADLPESYEREAGVLPDARDLRVDASQTVVGYVVPGNAQDAFDRLEKQMTAKGWASVPLGGVTGATFTKRDGSLSWMVATCNQVGDSASVVTRCLSS